ncbi:MAG: hypothetical protein CVV41_16255 [Candidatus Riflebacteria bacterium HGW-Riflebacteria-1]|jgi:hypothetical protein|nr:MAG: hypothetical protein CVV41_16255 [Candidatus Riflebacteria bacterium HGW-Riflebacteria-1]
MICEPIQGTIQSLQDHGYDDGIIFSTVIIYQHVAANKRNQKICWQHNTVITADCFTATQMDEHNNSGIARLVEKQVENARPKLLDLSRRNPLLATKFSDRSNSHVRVIDELPNVLFTKINQSSMTFKPLPALEDDPADESTDEFRKALVEARFADGQYQSDLENIDQSKNDAADKLAAVDRALKDRIRELLRMPARQQRTGLSLIQHARNNGFDPSYDLPNKDLMHQDGRHTDDLIQTLLLPEMMERRLNSMIAKNKSWEQETGISVLQAAFGFLEWRDTKDADYALAPILLLQVKIDKKKSRSGYKFEISGSGDSPQVNTVLTEKLRLEFGINFPEYDEELYDPEAYFERITHTIPEEKKWRIRRQVAVGIFPSARMAMYKDLAPGKWDYGSNKILDKIFGGSASSGSPNVFAGDYEIDNSAIEQKVPYLVADADSSQFSTIVDAVSGIDLAVEGPPGTGKSQTIVNTIAAFLAEGKKVLFVGAKSAALEVVFSRLCACGLGEFILPLQATKTSRSTLMQSIRDRIELSASASSYHHFRETVSEFKASREEIAKYISVLTTPFGDKGFIIFDVLGKAILTKPLLNGFPDDVLEEEIKNCESWSKSDLEKLEIHGTRLEDCWHKASASDQFWKNIQPESWDGFTVEQSLRLASELADNLEKTEHRLEEVKALGLTNLTVPSSCQNALNILDKAIALNGSVDFSILLQLNTKEKLLHFKTFINKKEYIEDWKKGSGKALKEPESTYTSDAVCRLAQMMLEFDIESTQIDSFLTTRSNKDKVAKRLEQVSDLVKRVLALLPTIDGISIEKIRAICGRSSLLPSSAASILRKFNIDPGESDYLNQSFSSAKLLIAEGKRLDSLFILTALPKREELSEHISQLRTAGFFSFLFPAYNRAKRTYLAIRRDGSFNLTEAATHFVEILDWQAKCQEFDDNARLKYVLGELGCGLKTDFASIIEVINFLRDLNSVLPGPELRGIREQIKNSSSETLRQCPAWEEWPTLDELASLMPKEIIAATESARAIANAVANAESTFLELQKCFSEPQTLSAQRTNALAKETLQIRELISFLDDNETIRRIMGDKFLGSKIEYYAFAKTISAAELMHELSEETRQIVSTLWAAGKLTDLHNAISNLIEAYKAEAVGSELLLAKTGAMPAFFSEKLSRNELITKLREAAKDQNGFIYQAKLSISLKETFADNFAALQKSLHSGITPIDDIGKRLIALVVRSMARKIYSTYGHSLCRFYGEKLDGLRERLAELDRRIIKLSQQELRSCLLVNFYAPEGNGRGKRSEWTDMALIKNELKKKTRFLPPREFTKRAGPALLGLKPCWMMSPLAVAQYIPKGSVEFDLVVIDEASQMPPEDAIGALLRGRQTMIVGDTNQLPPTTFFHSLLNDAELDEDETVTEESILELANNAFRPIRRLRWHYRSRHGSLIAFSNRFVYDNGLIVFPSPMDASSNLGVSLVKVDGRYNARMNPPEAQAMVDAAIRFMREQPDRSLGIVVLNQMQRDFIQEEMEWALQRDHKAMAYVEDWETRKEGLESFFIKNLENVQGDERDVIFIGTVYGPAAPGQPVMQRFGPISGVAGKRRLNVLFSRSRYQIVTFTSMTAADIKAEEHTNPGSWMLKKWLEYCTGAALDDAPKNVRVAESDSDFERHVIQVLKTIGCEPVPQVGVSGYFIDIGVRHPSWPHGFIMGIECDGRMYHSSKSARDRDRLRQEVLENLGWYLYRIWSTDWFENPNKETEKLRVIIKDRLNLLLKKTEKTSSVPIPQATAVQDKTQKTAAQDLDERIKTLMAFQSRKLQSLPGNLKIEIQSDGVIKLLRLIDHCSFLISRHTSIEEALKKVLELTYKKST